MWHADVIKYHMTLSGDCWIICCKAKISFKCKRRRKYLLHSMMTVRQFFCMRSKYNLIIFTATTMLWCKMYKEMQAQFTHIATHWQYLVILFSILWHLLAREVLHKCFKCRKNICFKYNIQLKSLISSHNSMCKTHRKKTHQYRHFVTKENKYWQKLISSKYLNNHNTIYPQKRVQNRTSSLFCAFM